MELFRSEEAVAIDDVVRTMREICALIEAVRPVVSDPSAAKLTALQSELTGEEAALIAVLARQDDRAGQPSDEKILLEVAALKLRSSLADNPDEPVESAIADLKTRLTDEANVALSHVNDDAARDVLQQIAE